ncbi:DNA replication complex GINS family protein [Candidatus Woesearchaeota archaeon]|nr:DNA replication complex GINS family protein [Candidatus Woesearchaeota archaeon]
MEEQTGQTQQAQPVKITFTYESLFDMVVREKSKEELQQLSQNFFTELVSYLNEKKSAVNILNSEEREKANRQLLNINRLVKELYERREKKILGLALARSRAGVDIIDTSALLAEEKAFFDGLVRQLDVFREGVLNSLLVAKSPKHMAEAAEMAAEKAATAAAEGARSEENPTKLVRFLHAVPRFVGRELEVYGPFDHEDIANLPREIAEVLIAKGRAEEMAQA